MIDTDDDFFNDIAFLANRAVKLAQEENRRLGIPNVYSFKGTKIFELPDGTLTFENPFDNKTAATLIKSIPIEVQGTEGV
ncbi:MAG: hypothetical protein AB2L14_02885 [Candidatus Xenobiia bacterium LiM19]